MGIVNRGLVVVRPKQPFLDWLRRLPERVTDVVLDQLRADCNAYLVPEWENVKGTGAGARSLLRDDFEDELNAWHRIEAGWPKKRTVAVFREWFDVEPVSMVTNLVPGLADDDDI